MEQNPATSRERLALRSYPAVGPRKTPTTSSTKPSPGRRSESAGKQQAKEAANASALELTAGLTTSENDCGFTRIEPLPREELPEKLCDACGLLIDSGVRLPRRGCADLLLYDHELKQECAELRELNAARERLQLKRWSAAARRGETGLSERSTTSDGLIVTDYASYLEAFPETPVTERGRGMGGWFLAAVFGGPAVRKPETGFTLVGVGGSGKTTLIEALGRSLHAGREPVVFTTAPDLNNERFADEAVLERLKLVDYLLLDDLGSETATEWWIDQFLFPLVKSRARSARPIVATSNYDWDTLTSLWEQRGAKKACYVTDTLTEFAGAVAFGPARSFRRARFDFVPGN